MDKIAKAHKEITGLLFDRLPDFATNDFETRWAECEALGWAIVKRQGEEREADLATAQAQVAVMAEALDLALIPMVSEEKKLSVNIAEYGLTSSLDAWQEQTLSELEARKAALVEAQDAVMNALSAAPKVVWSANALVIGWDGAFKELLIEKGDLTFITGTEELEKYVGRQAQVIVLDKQGVE